MSDKPHKPRRPIAEVRAELMSSPETQELAKNLGLKLEDYVEKVLGYYQDPAKEPMVYVASEEQVRAAGVKPTTEKDVIEYLEKVDRGEIDLRPDHLKDGFADTEKPKVAGVGAPAPGRALREQVQQQVKKDQTPKG